MTFTAITSTAQSNAQEASECDRAVEVLKLAVQHHSGTSATDKAITDTAEYMWRWVMSTDLDPTTWPDPSGWPTP